MRAVLLALAVAAVALGAAAVPARAAGLEVGIEDERVLLSEPAAAPAVVAKWKALGVDVVRIHAHWWQIAPGMTSKRMPKNFHASDPDDKQYNWTALDTAVKTVRAAGLRVMLTVTGPGPLWASRDPSRDNLLWEPRSDYFGQFAHAVAERYGADVDRYLVWNEPNQPGWLQPQSSCVDRVCTPVAPHIYRGLVRAATRAIHAADPGSQVLLGELAPIGNPPRTRYTPLAPLPFLRAMACVDAHYKPIHGGRCAGFKPAFADAFGYHPHPVHFAPDEPNPDHDDAQFADLGRLFTVLDRLTKAHRIEAPNNRFDVYLTEFGYQTAPPDPASGVTLAQQTRYLQQAAYIAWRTPRVRGLSYYQWEDEPVVDRGPGTKQYSGWQSGLSFVTGRPKPVLSTFAAPFVVDSVRSLLWGQVRPAAEPQATILIRPRGDVEFHPMATVTLAADGSFAKHVGLSLGASYRYQWTPQPTLADPDPAPRLSGVVNLADRQKTTLRAGAALAG